jgi:nitronate monooxygenase
MAGAQGPALALAVCAAGGLGSIPAAMLSPAQLEQDLGIMAASARSAWAANFFCHASTVADAAVVTAWKDCLADYAREWQAVEMAAGPGRRAFDEAICDLVEPFRPPVMSFHFGLPNGRLVSRIKAWGASIMSSATTVAEAQWLAANGADVVIAQGLEAGGHRGHFLADDLNLQMPTMSLLPAVAAAVSCPVVAAGGIATACQVRAAFNLGAAAGQVGTRFLTSHEAQIASGHRAMLLAGTHLPTALTNLFTGRPARGLVNRLMQEQGSLRADVPAFPHAANVLAPIRVAAEAKGCLDFSPLWAGTSFGACTASSAAQIVAELMHAQIAR